MTSPPFKAREVPNAGTGLFTTTDLDVHSLLLKDTQPFVAVIDSKYLTTACSWCFVWTGETQNVKLSNCSGCKILRYCGKACQKASWKHSHRFECKIYERLYPNVLPNTGRMAMQILLRRGQGSLSPDDWNEFLRLVHHNDHTKALAAEGDETWENIQLVARAAKEYSGSKEDLGLVESLVGRMLTNTFALNTSLFTPIGIMLSLPISLLNHSCWPNTAVTLSNRTISLRTISPLPANTELSISYIDNSFSPETRRAELSRRYNFTCNCSQCMHNLTLNLPSTISFLASSLKTTQSALSDLEEQATTIYQSTTTQPSDKALAPLIRAFILFTPLQDYPPSRPPLCLIRASLIESLLATKHWTPAFILTIYTFLNVVPVQFPTPSDPVRVAKEWVLARLVSQMGALSSGADLSSSGGEADAARAFSEKFQLDWGAVMVCLVADVAEKVAQSHGAESRFTKEVESEWEETKNGLRAGGQEGMMEEAVRKGIWDRLEVVGMEGWGWWKAWERERRKRRLKGVRESDLTDEAIGILLGERHDDPA